MLKIYCSSLILSLFLLSGLQAQTCAPDRNLPDSVIVDPLPFTEDAPMQGIADTACVGGYFETVFQFQVPDTLTVAGFSLQINNVTIPSQNAVTNLPASFRYACNPPNCVFPRDSVGCLVLYGTAVAGDVGVHNLMINVVIDINPAGPLPFTLPNAALGAGGNYYLHVKPAGGANCTIVGAHDRVPTDFSATVRPNPLGDRAQLAVSIETAGEYEFTVFSPLGQQVHYQLLRLGTGDTTVDIDAAKLPTGVYTYVLRRGQQAATGRVVVQR